MPDSNSSCASRDSFRVSRVDLTGRTLRGTALSGFGTVFRFVGGLVTSSVMARLLTPPDFGLFEIVSSVAGVFAGVKSLGLAEATVQDEELDQEKASGLFWVNVAFGAVLSAIMVFLGPLLAVVYSEPALAWLNGFVGITFLLSGLSVQHGALLVRQQQFGKALTADIAGLTIAGVAAALAAMKGWGPWSLAIQAVLASVSVAICLWLMMSWRPNTRVVRGPALGSLLRFGGNVTLARLIAVVSFRLDKLLLAGFVATEELGQYGRASYLAMLFQSYVVGAVEMPVRSFLSRIWADSPSLARKSYFRYLRLLVAFPLFGGLMLSLVAPEVVRLVLGPQWERAGEFFRILAVGGTVRILHSAAFTPFVSFGEGGRLLRWSVRALLVLLPIYIVAAPFGSIAMSFAYVIVSVLVPAYGIAEAVRIFDMGNELRSRENWRVLLAVTLAYVSGLCARLRLDQTGGSMVGSPSIRIAILLLSVSTLYVVFLGTLSRPTLSDARHLLGAWLRSRDKTRRSVQKSDGQISDLLRK